MAIASVTQQLELSNENEVNAQKETTGVIRRLIDKIGLLTFSVDQEAKDKKKQDRDAKRAAGGRSVLGGSVKGFQNALQTVNKGLRSFTKGLKATLSSLIDTFSFSNLKSLILSPLKLVIPGLLLAMGQMAFGNMFGGGLLAAGVLTGNPMLMMAGIFALMIGNIPKIKTALDELLDPDDGKSAWYVLGEKLPGWIIDVFKGTFARLKEIFTGVFKTLGLGDTAAGVAGTVVGGLGTAALAKKLLNVATLGASGALLSRAAPLARAARFMRPAAIPAAVAASVAASVASRGPMTDSMGNKLVRSARTGNLMQMGADGKATSLKPVGAARGVSGLGRLGRFAGTAARGLGKIALPITAAFALFDAYKGFAADENASVLQKTGNALSSIANGFTFGLIGKSPAEIASEIAVDNADTAGNMLEQAEGVVSDSQRYIQDDAVNVREVGNQQAPVVVMAPQSSSSVVSNNTTFQQAIGTSNPFYA
jgi:hypothetical protein